MWEVCFPLLLPIVASLIVVYFIWTGPNAPTVKWETVIEFAPWTLSFFSLTLIGSILRRTQQNHSTRQVPFGFLIFISCLLAMNSGFLLLWRQVDGWRPDSWVWSTTGLLTLIAIGLCYALERQR